MTDEFLTIGEKRYPLKNCKHCGKPYLLQALAIHEAYCKGDRVVG